MTTVTTPARTARTVEPPAVTAAAALVEQWNTEDRRFFVNFMCGYDPEAVTSFDECRRRINASGPNA